MKELWLLGVFAWQAWKDIHFQKLSGAGLLVFWAVGIPVFVFRILQGGIVESASLVPGLFLVGISLLSRAGLGKGDVLLLIGTGFYLSWERVLITLSWALFYSSLWAGLLFFRRRRGKEEFPFVPFVLLGYVGGLYLWRM